MTTDMTGWPHLYRPGTGPVLLMLHGTGSNEEDIATLAGRIDPAAAVLAPRGRVEENGANRWFRRHGEGRFDVDDVIFRAAELAGFVAWARAEYRIENRSLVAVGFSNGANIALALALLHPEAVRRAIAFSGMYPLGERSSPSVLTDTRVLALNGDSDPMAPGASVDRLAAELEGRGVAFERIRRAGGHGITEREVATAAEWLRANT
jgi:phospholipase/carboxylesterase